MTIILCCGFKLVIIVLEQECHDRRPEKPVYEHDSFDSHEIEREICLQNCSKKSRKKQWRAIKIEMGPK